MVFGSRGARARLNASGQLSSFAYFVSERRLATYALVAPAIEPRPSTLRKLSPRPVCGSSSGVSSSTQSSLSTGRFSLPGISHFGVFGVSLFAGSVV